MRRDRSAFGNIHILLWIIVVALLAFLFWNVANYNASVQSGGQVSPQSYYRQFAVMAFILGFSGFLISAKRKQFTKDRNPWREGRWGTIFGILVTGFFWAIGAVLIALSLEP